MWPDAEGSIRAFDSRILSIRSTRRPIAAADDPVPGPLLGSIQVGPLTVNVTCLTDPPVRM